MKAKIDDDINDEKAVKAKAAALVYRSAIKKAENEYPVLAEIVSKGYFQMYTLEQSCADILDICDAFSLMMVKLMSTAYGLGKKKLDFIKAISRWLYFIDQLDDYDEDVAEGKFNPLVISSITKTEMVCQQHEKLFEYLHNLFIDFQEIKKNFDFNCVEDRILYAVINESIPNVTSLVLSNRRLPQIAHRKKEFEWKED